MGDALEILILLAAVYVVAWNIVMAPRPPAEPPQRRRVCPVCDATPDDKNWFHGCESAWRFYNGGRR